MFSGTLYAYLHGVNYTTPDGGIISGDSILKDHFDVDYSDEGEWRHWMDLVIAVAFLMAFRFQHYMLMVRSTGKLGNTLPAEEGEDDTFKPPAKSSPSPHANATSTVRPFTPAMRSAALNPLVSFPA